MSLRTVSIGVLLFAALSFSPPAPVEASQARTPSTKVAIVEPDAVPPGYRVVLSGTSHRGLDGVLDALAEGYRDGDRLAILFDVRVPIDAVTNLAPMASKVGYFGPTLKLFAMGTERRGMVELTLTHNYIGIPGDPVDAAETAFSK